MMREFQFALRRLLRHPWSSLSMLLGIALSFAIVIITSTLMQQLRALPASLSKAPPVQLVTLAPAADPSGSDRRTFWSYPGFQALQNALPAGMKAHAVTLNPISMTIATPAGSVRAPVEVVSTGYFDALNIAPDRGLGFSAGAETGSSEILISHREWQRRFASNPNLINQTVRVQGVPFTIVGVLPEGFRGLSEQADYWVPMAAAPTVTFPSRLKGAQSFWHSVFVTGTPNASISGPLQASTEAVNTAINLQQAGQRIELALGTVAWTTWRADAGLTAALRTLAVCAEIMLAIVALNLGMVGLARLSSRRRELGVLAAVGATPWRLLLATVGELLLLLCAGLLSAWVLADLVLRQLPYWLGDLIGTASANTTYSPDLMQLLRTGLLGLAVALLLIILAGRLGQLKRTAELVRGGDHRPVQRWHLWIAGIQFALASALTLAAVLAAGLAWRAMQTPLGFAPEQVLSAQISIPDALQPADGVAGFLGRFQTAAARLPGIEAVAAAGCLPVRGGCDFVNVEPAVRTTDQDWQAGLNQIDGDYLRAMGIRLFQGRSFNAQDRADSKPVVLINRSFAAQYLSGREALGQQVSVSIGWPETGSAEIVGVVDDTLGTELDAAAEPMVYVPIAQAAYSDNFLVLKMQDGVDPSSIAGALERTLAKTEPNLALWDLATMSQRFADLTERRRVTAFLVFTVTLLAVLLAALGVYATFSLNMAERRKEFAVRVALGATVGELRSLIFKHVLRFTGLSALLGLGTGALLANLLSEQLPALNQQLPTPYALVLVIMSLTAIFAVWMPARQALRAEPTAALKAGS